MRLFSSSISFRNAAAAPAAAAAQQAAPPMPDLSTPTEAVETKPALSICKPGTTLSGLNYIKGKSDPVAKEDSEYPEWLWSCLDVQKKASDAAEDEAGDEFCE
jgi:large subunit ribosomal protein L54